MGILDRPDEIVLQTSGGDYRTKHLINCCGLQSDLIAKMTGGANQDARTGAPHHSVSRRVLQDRAGTTVLGEKSDLSGSRSDISVFGVHFTRMAKGGVEAGPNAVLAYAREGYRHTKIN